MSIPWNQLLPEAPADVDCGVQVEKQRAVVVEVGFREEDRAFWAYVEMFAERRDAQNSVGVLSIFVTSSPERECVSETYVARFETDHVLVLVEH